MSDFVQTAEADIERLQAALAQSDKARIDRAVSALERDLIDNEGYKAVGDERLLATAYRFLLQCYGDKPKLQLQGLYQHLELIQAIQDRFSRYLTTRLSWMYLLIDLLARWPLIEQLIRYSFEKTVKDELHRARSTGNTEQRLGNFLAAYLQHMRNQGLSDTTDTLQNPIELALEGYKRSHSSTVHGLFTTTGEGQVYGLKIRAEGNGQGRIRCLGSIGPEMRKAADGALECVKGLRASSTALEFHLGHREG